MNAIRHLSFVIFLTAGTWSATALAQSDDPPRTVAEQSDYVRTGRYADAVAFCRRLAKLSDYAQYASFGHSAEGRDLPLLILSTSDTFSPQRAHADGRPIVLLQNCIHAGECAGKDASLALARDLLFEPSLAGILQKVNVLIIPIFNTDGHERFSPYSRINQNGPQEMGWRVTALNLNLNRDYTKADTPEMRAWLRLWTSWQPDLYFDNHTTNGSDHRICMFYSATTGPLTAEPVARWLRETLERHVLPAVERDGFLTFPYGGPVDRTDPAKGYVAWAAHTPRFSTGYGAVCNRPTVLVEVHALKPYRQRVQSTYSMLLHTLQAVARAPQKLRAAIAEADRTCAERRGADRLEGRVVLRLKRSEQGRDAIYRAVRFEVVQSDISGGPVIRYSSDPLDVPTTLYDQVVPAETVAPPTAYVVPRQWQSIIERLRLHGVELVETTEPRTLTVERYRFTKVSFPPRPYESRFQPKFELVSERVEVEYPASTLLVPLNQPRAKLAVHLLEPQAPDSLVRWGLINQIFERKEYFEDYVMEPIARRMLAEDESLRAEFERKLKSDAEFAADPRARLEFFYERSPYYDQNYNVYPITRLLAGN